MRIAVRTHRTPACRVRHLALVATVGLLAAACAPATRTADAVAPRPTAARPAPTESAGEPNAVQGPPSDHVKNRDGALHKHGAKRPSGDCTGCHGEDLRGSGRAPSCYRCHEKKWR